MNNITNNNTNITFDNYIQPMQLTVDIGLTIQETIDKLQLSPEILKFMAVSITVYLLI